MIYYFFLSWLLFASASLPAETAATGYRRSNGFLSVLRADRDDWDVILRPYGLFAADLEGMLGADVIDPLGGVHEGGAVADIVHDDGDGGVSAFDHDPGIGLYYADGWFLYVSI